VIDEQVSAHRPALCAQRPDVQVVQVADAGNPFHRGHNGIRLQVCRGRLEENVDGGGQHPPGTPGDQRRDAEAEQWIDGEPAGGCTWRRAKVESASTTRSVTTWPASLRSARLCAHRPPTTSTTSTIAVRTRASRSRAPASTLTLACCMAPSYCASRTNPTTLRPWLGQRSRDRQIQLAIPKVWLAIRLGVRTRGRHQLWRG